MPMSRPRIRHISASERAGGRAPSKRDPPGRRRRPAAGAASPRARSSTCPTRSRRSRRAPRPPPAAIDTSRRIGQAVDGDRERLDGEEAHARPRAPRGRGRPRPPPPPSPRGSRIITPPASTATPARPAAAAPSTVPGPIAGRSMRRSWPGFGPLKSTPRAPAGRTGGGGARDEVEHGVGALDRTRARGRCRRPPPPPGRRRPRRAPRRSRAARAASRAVGRRRARRGPSTPGGGDEVGQDLVRRAHREALGLEDAGDHAQRGVVARRGGRGAPAARGAAS